MTVTTGRGQFSFTPAKLTSEKPQTFLDGQAAVERSRRPSRSPMPLPKTMILRPPRVAMDVSGLPMWNISPSVSGSLAPLARTNSTSN